MATLRVPALNISAPLEVEEELHLLQGGEIIQKVREALRGWFGREPVEVSPQAVWDGGERRWVGSLTYHGEVYQWIVL
ncbi:MAG: hypothetical protein HY347_05930 [candidate division NC10 bacterium]|nr:hypothetical protein [candidate division NC10 bacterium]